MNYIVSYAKIQDDKEMGMLMTGIYFGGLCADEVQADKLAKKCVSETQGGIVIPKVMKLKHRNLLEAVRNMEAMFDEMADTMYDNEEAYNRDNRHNI